MSKQRNTGLAGVDALFQPQVAQEAAEPAMTPAIESKPIKKGKKKANPDKLVTTVRVYPDTLAKIQKIKINELEKEGRRVDIGDILDEAVRGLFERKGLE